MEPTSELGTYTILNTADERWTVDAADESRIDAGVTQYLGSGCTRDTLLDLTTTEGEPLRILASQVVSWLISTPASRQRYMMRQKAEQDEVTRLRREAGFPDDEEGWKSPAS